jgi:hypothetical protein
MLRIKHLAPVTALAFLFACTDAAKVPAEAAIKGAETALAGVKAEAAQWVPDQLKAVEGAIAQAKDLAAKSDFKGALAIAKDLPAKAAGLATAAADAAKAAAAAKKDEATKQFAAVTGPVGQLVDAIKSRLDILGQAKKLPKGVDAKQVAAAKDGLAGVQKDLADAGAKLAAGNFQEALAAAAPLKDKAMAIAASIGLKF